ncbi:MAG: aldehyde dehydrogenase [Burkholderiales bacterium]|nr:aldehyde dehydrogenase [Burkholderiales bacterium]
MAEQQRPTSHGRIDAMLARLREGARAFAKLPIADRIALARGMQAGYLKIADASVKAGCAAKGTTNTGEEWALNPWMTVRHLRLIIESLGALQQTGNTRIGKVATAADGSLRVQVFPASRLDGMLFSKVRVDVHMQPRISEQAMHESRARFYKKPDHDGRIALVLGAGNIAAVAVMDLLTKMFNEGKACVFKMNPVNAYLGPYIEQAFADAIAKDYLAVVYGGAEEGAYLVQHKDIAEIHITGSDKTYDAIVWGPPGAEREARKARNDPLLKKPITAELGNVSPVIVVPGPYSEKELCYQAEDIAATSTTNGSFNCNAARVVLTPRGWRPRSQLLARVESVFAATPPRNAYYPGARKRWDELMHGRSNARTFGAPAANTLPWTLLSLNAGDNAEPAFREEFFCPVLGEAEIGSNDPLAFLDEAVNFANGRLWGTLSATLIVHPKSMKDARIREAVENAIVRLRYGTVGVNAWPGMSFAFGTPPWGAFPGSSQKDIQSGSGFVHNTPMLEGIEKTVLRHPLTTFPKPAYFPSHKTVNAMMPRMTAFEERQALAKVPGVLAAAMRC